MFGLALHLSVHISLDSHNILLSVVIDYFNIKGITLFKPEDYAPLHIDADAPEPL
jgi:hypothetical protein